MFNATSNETIEFFIINPTLLAPNHRAIIFASQHFLGSALLRDHAFGEKTSYIWKEETRREAWQKVGWSIQNQSISGQPETRAGYHPDARLNF